MDSRTKFISSCCALDGNDGMNSVLLRLKKQASWAEEWRYDLAVWSPRPFVGRG
jgi:hypothetical protein